MKTKSKTLPEMDWSRFETIPFAVLIFSTEVGWIECHHEIKTVADARKAYEGMDGKKMLLNYGSIIAEAP